MPEGDTAEPVELSEVTQAFLTKYGLKDVSHLDEVFGTYKTDLAELKSNNKTLTADQKEFLKLKKEAEEKRTGELSDIERMKEESGAKDKSISTLQAEIEGMKKSRLYDNTFFEHASDKNMMSIRKTLYAAAAGSQAWETDTELKEIFTAVDTDFEKSIKEGNINLAPGDRRFVTLPGADDPVKSDYFNS